MPNVIVVDRIEPGVTPEYCTHGRATCVRCQDWCWLGDKTHDLIKDEGYLPLCLTCANEVFPRGTHEAKLAGHIRDHRRADGPHGA